MSENQAKVIDWTEHALNKFADGCYARGDASEGAIVDMTIQLYRDGMLNVKWDNGQPIFSLTPDAKIICDVMKGTPESSIMEDILETLEEMNNERE